MTATVLDDPILKRFRAALGEMYGDRIDRVVLFGSRARGDHHAESDYDIAVFLDGFPDRWTEIRRLADLQMEFLDRTGEFLVAQPFPATAYVERTPLMREIRRDGVSL